MRDKSERIAVLDGVRAYAILIVMGFHLWQQSWLQNLIPHDLLQPFGVQDFSLTWVPRTGYMFVDVLLLLSGWGDVLGNLACYARARVWPSTFANVEWLARQSGQEAVDRVWETDQRAELGTMTVRVWQVGLDRVSEQGGTAYVAFSCWDEEPWAEPVGFIEVYNATDGAEPVHSMGGSWGAAYAVPVVWGDALQVCWYDELDHQYETLLTVELPWEESP